MIHGLVSLDGQPIAKDMEVPANADNNRVFGAVFTQGDSPAANHRLHLVTRNEGDSRLDINVVTDESGGFEVPVEGQHLFDVEIYNEEDELVEFIDLHKLPGALHTLITLGDEEDNNVHRYDQSAITTNEEESDSDLKSAFSSHGNRPFAFAQCYTDNKMLIVVLPYGYLYSEFREGSLTVNGGYLSPTGNPDEIAEKSGVTQLGNYLDVELKDDGSWWYSYKVHISTNIKMDVAFIDETEDQYELNISDPDASYKHTVSYNSDSPSIKKIWLRRQISRPDKLPGIMHCDSNK
jgi:hypothetical protein